jgi:hypothetical protein
VTLRAGQAARHAFFVVFLPVAIASSPQIIERFAISHYDDMVVSDAPTQMRASAERRAPPARLVQQP